MTGHFQVAAHALRLLVIGHGGSISTSPGWVEVSRGQDPLSVHRRSYDESLPIDQRRKAEARALREAIRSCFPEFFTLE